MRVRLLPCGCDHCHAGEDYLRRDNKHFLIQPSKGNIKIHVQINPKMQNVVHHCYREYETNRVIIMIWLAILDKSATKILARVDRVLLQADSV